VANSGLQEISAGTEDWVYFEFASPVALTIGATYVLELWTYMMMSHEWEFNNNGYALGNAIYKSIPSDELSDPTLANTDLLFRTFALETPPEEQIEHISEFFDSSVQSGQLQGTGPGKSAQGRLGALKNMIDEAERLIDEGAISEACQQLHSIYLHIDGVTPPPDFVEGTAAAELAVKILTLMEDLGCE